ELRHRDELFVPSDDAPGFQHAAPPKTPQDATDGGTSLSPSRGPNRIPGSWIVARRASKDNGSSDPFAIHFSLERLAPAAETRWSRRLPRTASGSGPREAPGE